MAKHALDFWLTSEDLPRREQPRDAGKRRTRAAELYRQQHGRAQTLGRETQKARRKTRHGRKFIPLVRLFGKNNSHRRHRAPMRHREIWKRPEDVRARRELQSARAGQSLRGRRELLRLQHRGQPRPHHHGERAARRGPLALLNERKKCARVRPPHEETNISKLHRLYLSKKLSRDTSSLFSFWWASRLFMPRYTSRPSTASRCRSSTWIPR